MKTLLVEPHPNVVRLLGCCTAASDKEPTYLIMEYVAKGKLQEFLRRCASIIVTTSSCNRYDSCLSQVPG